MDGHRVIWSALNQQKRSGGVAELEYIFKSFFLAISYYENGFLPQESLGCVWGDLKMVFDKCQIFTIGKCKVQ
jgi:hypothetical protein